MNGTRLFFALACSAGFAAMCAAGAAQAHDPKGKGGLPMAYQKRIMAGMQGLEKIDNSDQAKGLYSRLVQWPPSYAKLRVCFMGGNKRQTPRSPRSAASGRMTRAWA